MKASLQRIWVVLAKEFVDNLRDLRSVGTVVITSLILPLIAVGMVVVMGRLINPDTNEQVVSIPVIGAENAPALVQFLKQSGIEILPAPADPLGQVRNGSLDVVLIIPADYGEEFNQSHPAPVQLVLDNTRMSASTTIQKLDALLYAYNSQITAMRLQARGINPAITNVLLIQELNQATPQSKTMIFLNTLPFFMIMTIFMGGMYVIIDATAGERERGSLEPLLINPVRRSEFVLGKLGASLPFALFIMLLCLATIGISFNKIPLEQFTGYKMSIGMSSLIKIFWVCIPLVLLASALQMLLASFTRSFKEAQTYLSFLPLVAGMPGMFLVFAPVKTALWHMLIPGFAQSILINQIMRGESIDPLMLGFAALSGVVLSLLSLIISIKLYEKESILFPHK